MRESMTRSCFVVSAVLAAFWALGGAAQARAQEEGVARTSTRVLSVAGAVLRTPADMARDAARIPPTPDGAFINRPTTPLAAYREAKLRAALLRGSGKAVDIDAPPTLKGKNFNGTNQGEAGGGYPPDTHGTTGPSHFMEVTNQHVDIYRKSDAVRVNNGGAGISLNAFFGYFTEALFDPRAVYDIDQGRWLISAEAFPESATIQRHFLAISTTSDPLGSYFIYNVDVELGANDFFDFPQLGEDKGAVLMTANEFFAAGGVEAWLLIWPKSVFYSGTAGTVNLFTGLIPTAAPPVVIDGSAKSFIVSAPFPSPSANKLKLYTLRSSGTATPILNGPANVTVPSYTLPPNAVQPAPCGGASNELDTSDARFANASTQNGTNLFQVHSIDFAGFPANMWYQIDTSTKAVAASDLFFASGTSYDFNPSIAADKQNDVYITWSVTDPTAGTNPQVRFSGRLATDPADIPAGSALFTSLKCLTGNFDPNRGFQRWGDYSAVSLDPSSINTRAWIVNETVKNASTWGSRIGRIGNP
jgi:hypothetical protein